MGVVVSVVRVALAVAFLASLVLSVWFCFRPWPGGCVWDALSAGVHVGAAVVWERAGDRFGAVVAVAAAVMFTLRWCAGGAEDDADGRGEGGDGGRGGGGGGAPDHPTRGPPQGACPDTPDTAEPSSPARHEGTEFPCGFTSTRNFTRTAAPST